MSSSKLSPAVAIPGATEIRDWTRAASGRTTLYRRNNLHGSRLPSGVDDESQRYHPGSVWVYNSRLFLCTSSALGLAAWRESGTVTWADVVDKPTAFAPAAHASAHATGQADAISPASIGAATASQGIKADVAVQFVAAPSSLDPDPSTDFSMFPGAVKPETDVVYHARDAQFEYTLCGSIDAAWKRHPVSTW